MTGIAGDNLGVDVLRGAMHRQPMGAEFTDLGASTARAAQTAFLAFEALFPQLARDAFLALCGSRERVLAWSELATQLAPARGSHAE